MPTYRAAERAKQAKTCATQPHIQHFATQPAAAPCAILDRSTAEGSTSAGLAPPTRYIHAPQSPNLVPARPKAPPPDCTAAFKHNAAPTPHTHLPQQLLLSPPLPDEPPPVTQYAHPVSTAHAPTDDWWQTYANWQTLEEFRLAEEIRLVIAASLAEAEAMNTNAQGSRANNPPVHLTRQHQQQCANLHHRQLSHMTTTSITLTRMGSQHIWTDGDTK